MTTKPTVFSYIRFSSKGQEQGDSLRRQMEESRKYAKENGWVLDESMKDLGVSAWKGKNRTVGALAAFLALVQGGKIAKGSWLIVEAMDRLSREQVSDALSTFLSIIKAGVGIVTLQDRKSYTVKSVNSNPMELMMGIALMASANEYSTKLSFRLREARASSLKRLAAGGHEPVHACPPYWCDMQDGKYHAMPERVATVKKMIAWSMEGVGVLGIARRLSASDIPTKGGSKTWNKASIRQILRSKALMGDYQPQHMVEGKRVPAGDPVRGYYPPVMTESDWLRMQAKMDTRQQTLKGRSGETTNVFGRVMKSGNDGSGMVVAQSAAKGRSYHRLVSSDTLHGGSHTPGFPYHAVESAFLHFITEITLDKPQAEESNLPTMQAEEKALASRLAKLQTAMVEGDAQDIVTIAAAARQVEGKLLATRKAIEAEKAQAVATKATTSDFEGLATKLFKSTNKGELRQAIKMAIADTCKEMVIWVEARDMIRAAVVKVVFHGGQIAHFGVRTETRKNPILAMASRSKFATQSPQDMLTALLDGQYAGGDFILTLQEEKAGQWKATTPTMATDAGLPPTSMKATHGYTILPGQ